MAITTLTTDALNLTGKEKAAGLLIGLGSEISSTILKLLPEGELDKITTELLNMERLDPAVRDAIFEEAYQLSLGHEYVSSGGTVISSLISSGGTAIVSGGGTASDTTVLSGAMSSAIVRLPSVSTAAATCSKRSVRDFSAWYSLLVSAASCAEFSGGS